MVILFVDDDPDDVHVFCEGVRHVAPEAHCIVAYNGQQALTILQSGAVPDYIFLDINMQVMNGMETLKALRKDRRFRKVPVIMYATTINPQDIPSYRKEGASQFLVKPSKFDELCDSLRGIVKSVVTN